jgi:hypothetical protein
MEYTVIILICAVFAFYIAVSHLERKDLYNRLMSKDISEYMRNTEKAESEPRKSAHKAAIDKFHSKGL